MRFEQKELIGDSGVLLAKKLFKELGQPSLENEKKTEYLQRIKQGAFGILELKIDDS